MTIESGVMLEDWKPAMIVHCTRVKEKGRNVVINEVS